MQDHPLIITLLVLVSASLSAWLTRLICHPATPFHMLDHPNERSLHECPTPRGGGLAILIAFLICGAVVSLFYPVRGLAAITLSILGVSIISFLDDRYSVPAIYRFLAHGIAAAIIIYGCFSLQNLEMPGITWRWPYIVGSLFSAVFIVWMINLYNFMDGMDGFAGGMAVSGFGTFAVLGWMAGHEAFMAINLVISAAATGFLIYNFPPARIFMGDIGSSVLGLLAATLSLWGVRDEVFPFWIAVLVFSPFVVDATVTLIRRMLRREKIWQAHKTHFYQRLVQAGWGHRKTVLAEYVLMAACGGSALWVLRQPAVIQWSALILWCSIYVILAWLVMHIERRKRHGIQD